MIEDRTEKRKQCDHGDTAANRRLKNVKKTHKIIKLVIHLLGVRLIICILI